MLAAKPHSHRCRRIWCDCDAARRFRHSCRARTLSRRVYARTAGAKALVYLGHSLRSMDGPWHRTLIAFCPTSCYACATRYRHARRSLPGLPECFRAPQDSVVREVVADSVGTMFRCCMDDGVPAAAELFTACLRKLFLCLESPQSDVQLGASLAVARAVFNCRASHWLVRCAARCGVSLASNDGGFVRLNNCWTTCRSSSQPCSATCSWRNRPFR